MAGIPYQDVSYCHYSDWGYRKDTRIWTNLENWRGRKCARDCLNMIRTAEGRLVHKYSAQRGPSRGKVGDRSFTVLELYRIPPKLVEAWLAAATGN